MNEILELFVGHYGFVPKCEPHRVIGCATCWPDEDLGRGDAHRRERPMDLKTLKAELAESLASGMLLGKDESLATMHGKRVVRSILHELNLLEPDGAASSVVAPSVLLSQGQAVAAIIYGLIDELKVANGGELPERVEFVARVTSRPTSFEPVPVPALPLDAMSEPQPDDNRNEGDGRELTGDEAAQAVAQAFEQATTKDVEAVAGVPSVAGEDNGDKA